MLIRGLTTFVSLVLVNVSWCPTAIGQAPASIDHSLHVSVAAGINGFSLGEAADFHTSIVRTYRDSGLRLPTQRSFPNTLVLGADILYGVSERSRVGLGTRYTSTDAYSLYGDYSGTLDIVSTVDVLTLEGVSRFDLGQAGPVRPFAGARGGIVWGNVHVRERLDLGELGRSSSELKGSGPGFTAEGFGGFDVEAGPVTLIAHIGYRYSLVGQLEGAVYVDGLRSGSGILPFKLGLAGFVATIGTSLRIF